MTTLTVAPEPRPRLMRCKQCGAVHVVANMPEPVTPKLTRCKSCGESIFFVETRSGRRVPLDAEERPDGNIILEGPEPIAVYLHEGTTYTGPRYVSHFATCPDAPSFRRR